MPRAGMQEIERLPLAVTSGDPAGIGLEITVKAWADRLSNEIPPFALFADINELVARVRLLGTQVPIVRIRSMAEAAAVFDRGLPVIDIAQAEAAEVGRPSSRNGPAVIASIERAAAAAIAGEASALVTNPIAKSVLYGAGFEHPGHTEFLAAIAARAYPGTTHTPVMMLACDELRVVPLTIHVPISKVPGLITRTAIVGSVRILHRALILDFGIANPRIAVTGLNPHAGEAGSIGTEDRAVIAPAIAELVDDGLRVTGPHAADTLFHAQARSRYDAVVAMYHDQALIPIKTLAFDHGVNMTLGLPFVRTSPDHGTAFDIAGRGTARPYSLIEAMKLAREAALRRAKAAA